MQKLNVYPCGYSVHGPLIDWLLKSESKLLLIDTRRSPHSEKMPAWEQDALKERYQQRYRFAGQFLGNMNYGNGGAIKIADPVTGIRGLIAYLRQGYQLLLLCGCREYERCHRHVIVDLLQATLTLWTAIAQGQESAEAIKALLKERGDLVGFRDVFPQIVRACIRRDQTPPAINIVHPETLVLPGFTRCISLWQPWAWIVTHPDILVKCGVEPKKIENRDWTTRYRGNVLIHASSKVDSGLFDTENMLYHPYWWEKFGGPGAELAAAMPQAISDYARKAIVGVAELVEVVEHSESPWYVPGSYGFVLRNARPIGPILDYPGRPMLFDVPLSVVEQELKSA